MAAPATSEWLSAAQAATMDKEEVRGKAADALEQMRAELQSSRALAQRAAFDHGALLSHMRCSSNI